MSNSSKTAFDAILAFDARGFIFESILAREAGVPFIMARKKGKLPPPLITKSFQKEYGEETIQIEVNAIKKGWRVLIHDDVLATGGTSSVAAEAIVELEATVAGFNYLIEVAPLGGRNVLGRFVPDEKIAALVKY